MTEIIKQELRQFIDSGKAVFYPKFFKTAEGEYGYGDRFLGIKSVTTIKLISKKYFKNLSLIQIQEILQSPWHEERLLALDMLVNKFQKSKNDPVYQKEIFTFYINNIQYVNNWDLVDLSSYKIVGEYLLDKNKKILFDLAEDSFIWSKRIAIVSTMAFIKKQNHTDTTFILAEKLLGEKEDILHKAVGWLMREAGKKNENQLLEFIKKHYYNIPRTTLRYSIEKFPEETRQKILKGIF